MPPHLSIIIPAFNEEDRIGPTLDAVDAHVRSAPYTYEIIVVDDGSRDATARIVKEKIPTINRLSLISLPHNTGKGMAVRTGMLTARGEARLFMDADNSTSIEQVDTLLPLLGMYDIIVGSRLVSGAVVAIKQGVFRDVLGAIFRLIAHATVPLPVRDTQNGFKLFSARAAQDIFSALKTDGWSFDIEVLVRGQNLDYRITEVPIVWKNDGRSKVRLHHMPRMLIDLLRIRLKELTF